MKATSETPTSTPDTSAPTISDWVWFLLTVAAVVGVMAIYQG